jgi:hypothetical protein
MLPALAVAFLSTAVSWAAPVSYTATVDRNKAGVGDPILLTLTFSGVQSAAAPQVSLDGFGVSYIGPFTQLSVINGRSSSSVSHRYHLLPQKIGQFSIGPFSASIDGQTVMTNTITLDITKGSPTPQSDGSNSELGDRAYATIETDKKTAFLNEKFSLRVKMHANHLPIKDVHFPQLETQGFSVGAFGQPRQYQVAINGIAFDVLEFETQIFATRSGELTLGPAQINATLLLPRNQENSLPQEMQGFFSSAIFNNFFGAQTQPLEIKSLPVTITILPLPEEGKPADFSGAIGNFILEADPRPLKVGLGDPVTVTMSIRGQGNLATVTKPGFANENDFKIYEPEIKEDASGKIFEQVVSPQSLSVKEIPQVRFSFFNPASREYRTLTKGPWPLEVTQAPAQPPVAASNSQTQATVLPEEKIGVDIFYIKESGTWRNKDASYLYQHPGFWIMVAFPLPLLWGFLLWAQEKKKINHDTRYARRLLAPRKAKNGIRAARRLLKEGKSEEFVTTLSKLAREYFGDRFHIPGASITYDTVSTHTDVSRVPQDILDKTRHLFDVCDAARYALTTLGSEQMEQALNECEVIIDFFQKEPVAKGAS